ncbi:MAG TPA: hypothetical protein DEA78_23445, partial [Cyanobacteria bacterium UBA11159]|nr:hypothetical protein [Cyanobacteria bacterium UBA11159]
ASGAVGDVEGLGVAASLFLECFYSFRGLESDGGLVVFSGGSFFNAKGAKVFAKSAKGLCVTY